MYLHLVEVTNGGNWGKFAVGYPGAEEWAWSSEVDAPGPLLTRLGWTPQHLWVLDLQTGEGAYFRPGGLAKADLDRHRIWVCPMFEPFLAWLYRQDLTDLTTLPHYVELPDAPFSQQGYRRPGPEAERPLRLNPGDRETEATRAWVAERPLRPRALRRRIWVGLGGDPAVFDEENPPDPPNDEGT